MKFVPRKPPKDSIANRLLSLALVFCTAFAGVYMIAFYFSVRLAQGVRRTEHAEDAMFISSHPIGTAIACFLVAGFISLIFFLIKASQVIVTFIEFDDERHTILLGRKYYYSNSIKIIKIPYSELIYKVRKDQADHFNSGGLRIDIIQGKGVVGSTDTDNVLWEEEALKVRNILAKLKQVSSRVKTPSSLSAL